MLGSVLGVGVVDDSAVGETEAHLVVGIARVKLVGSSSKTSSAGLSVVDQVLALVAPPPSVLHVYITQSAREKEYSGVYDILG